MTLEERYQCFCKMLSEDVEQDVFEIYLRLATEKILIQRYPFGTEALDVEPRFENDLIELTIVLYNQRGVEGQSQHTENGITRRYRTEQEILKSIPSMAGIPS